MVAVAVGVVVALVVDLVVISLGNRGHGGPPPRLAVFSSPAGIRELLAISKEQPREVDWKLRLGLEFLRQKHYLSAADTLEQALANGAPEVPARWGLASCYEQLDQFDDALAQLERLRKLQPDSLAAPLRIAGVYERLDRRKDAKALLDAIPRNAQGFPTLRDSEGEFNGLERLAVAYGLLGDWRQSGALAATMLRANPKDASGHAIVGQALLETGKPVAAAPHFRAALAAAPQRLELRLSLARALEGQHQPSYDDEIVQLLEPIVQTGSPPGEVVYTLATIHERKHKWDWAAAYYASAARMGAHADIARKRSYENTERAGHHEQALYLRGREAELLHRSADAEKIYRELISLRPASDAGYRHLARVLQEKGDVRGAIVQLQKAARMKGANPRVYMRLALAYRALADRKKEDASWAEFRKRRPEEEYLVESNLATAADTAGRLDEAENHLRRCIQLKPDSPEYRTRLGQLLIERRSEPRRLEEAVKVLEQSVAATPDDGDAFLALGTAYRYSGLRQEAIWALRHAIDLEPGNGRPYQLLGETLLEAGSRAEGTRMLGLFKRYREYAQALSVLSLRLKRNPRNTEVARRLGALQERSGALADARVTYAKMLAVNPGDEWARKRLAEVQSRLGENEPDPDEVSSHAGGAALP
jgi:tetratricopeptide (TPR) repeat protein